MRPHVIAKTGTGTTAWIPVDNYQNPFSLALAIVVSGTITYDVEHTFDDIFNPTVTPTAFKHSVLVSQTTNKDGAYTAPVRAVRLNNTAGTGTATLTLLQGRV